MSKRVHTPFTTIDTQMMMRALENGVFGELYNILNYFETKECVAVGQETETKCLKGVVIRFKFR